MKKEEICDFEFKLKERGKPIFKAKGKKKTIKKELKQFFNFKF